MSKFKNKECFSSKNFKSEFIVSCLQLPKSRYKEVNWAKEMKIMNQLAGKCDNPDFWFHARTEFPIPSLAWFLTKDGRQYLNEKFRIFNFKLAPKHKIAEFEKNSPEKIGEDLIVNKKPKTLMDFLKK